MRYHLTLFRMTYQKSQQTTNVGEDVEKRELSFIVGGFVNWGCLYENSTEVPQKI